MIRRTLRNMEKATQLIVNKGYERSEANDIAIRCFDQSDYSKMPVEFYIDKIISKDLFCLTYSV